MGIPRAKHSLDFIRHQAEKMFLAGKSGYAIAKELDINDQTVSNWKKKYKWAEKYEDIHAKHMQELVDKAHEKTEEKINDLNSIQKAAITPIKDGVLSPQYFGEAAKAYMDASKLERELRQASINTQFVQDIAKIVLEEVIDLAVLNRIKVRIMNLLQKDGDKILAISGGNEIIEDDVEK